MLPAQIWMDEIRAGGAITERGQGVPGRQGASPRHTEGRVVRQRNPAPLTGSMASLCHENRV